VYSFVHWHAHELENQIELHISVHPPDLPIHEHNHEDHHCHSQHTGETDIISDWNFTLQKNKIKIKFSAFSLYSFTKLDNRPEIFQYTPLENPHTKLKYCLAKVLPQRAPPKIC
jgi:hypothetical protein